MAFVLTSQPILLLEVVEVDVLFVKEFECVCVVADEDGVLSSPPIKLTLVATFLELRLINLLKVVNFLEADDIRYGVFALTEHFFDDSARSVLEVLNNPRIILLLELVLIGHVPLFGVSVRQNVVGEDFQIERASLLGCFRNGSPTILAKVRIRFKLSLF